MEEKISEQLDGISSLSFCGGQQREVYRQRPSAAERSAAEGYLAEDHGEAERLLCMVVGRWHAVDLEEREEICGIAFRVGNPLSEVLRVRVLQGALA